MHIPARPSDANDLLVLSKGSRNLDCFDDSESNLENQSTIHSKDRSEVAFTTVPSVVSVSYTEHKLARKTKDSCSRQLFNLLIPEL